MSENFYAYMYGGNKPSKPSMEKVVEDKDDYHTTKYYTICCRDGDGRLLDLINYIAKNGNGGHSFDIVVDQGDEREKTFFWDGDGSDNIKSVVASKTGDDKELVGILLTALARIDFFTWIEGNAEEVDKQKLVTALSNINDITRQILEGAEYDDHMKEALREIKFIVNASNDPDDAKLKHIKYMAEEALKH